MHGQTDLVELRTIHCTSQRAFVDIAENGPFKAASLTKLAEVQLRFGLDLVFTPGDETFP